MPNRWWLKDGDDAPQEEHLFHDAPPEDDMEYSIKKETKQKKDRRKLHRWEAIGVTALAFFAICFVWIWIAVSKGMPTLDQLENPHPELATRLISADGERLDQYFIKNRTTVELKAVPRDVIGA